MSITDDAALALSPQRKLPAATWASVKREAKGGLPVKLLLKRMVKASHAM